MYSEWRGLFYPEKLPTKDWFAYYAQHFDTVEINNSFYRLPTAEAAEGWERQAPPGFVYALKLGQFGSHRKKLKDPLSGWLDNHLDRVRRLGAHLGPNLVQLPPRWKRDTARLDDFLHAAPKDIRWAVEMRDSSWLHDDVFHVLEKHGAALCIHDLLVGHPWIRTTDWTYVRFHGPRATEQPYYGRYGANRLRRPAARLTEWLQSGSDVYAYFNNDIHGHAVHDAKWLRSRLAAFEAVA
ncbi:MAG: hypothetical protein QOJ00_1423 [Actinomycetota bacterium]